MLNVEIVKNTIHKEIRNKGIIFLFVFTLVLLYFGHQLALAIKGYIDESALNSFIANSTQSVIVNFVSFSANFVAIIISTTIIRSDISSRLLPQVLAFPLSRLSYLLSRIFGGWVLSIFFYAGSLTLGILILLSSDSVKLDTFSLFLSSVFMGVELLGLILIGSFISLNLNRISSFILTTVFYIISKYSYYTIASNGLDLSEVTFGKILGAISYYALPRVGEMTFISEQFIAGKTFAFGDLSIALAHFSCLTIIWVLIMKLLFERREV